MVVMKRALLVSLLLFAAVGVVLASGEGEAETEAGGADEGTRQSPALQQQVDSGELPPLEERLPAEPLVVEPVDAIGQYGDEISFVSRVGSSATTRRTVSYQHLVKWDREFSKWIPNVAKNVIISDDSSSFIFELREGMRWSDGELFTADDIVFWYNELILNEDMFSSVPDWLRIGDEPATVTKVDDLAVEFRFSESNGFFLQNVASVGGYGPTSAPEHHIRQFMPEYNENSDQLAEERGYESALDMVAAMLEFTTMFDFVDMPRLDPWIYTTPLTEPTSRLVAERNPYFWKVDTEGNQLPYIDTFVTIQNDDRESLLLQALNGEVDYVHSYINNATNRPVIAQNRDRGDYDFVDVLATDSNAMAIALNLTHQDPVLREVFQNRDFRIGLSHAVNRQEIIEIVLGGQGQPHQVGPLPGTPFYNERLATQYTEFDLDLANEYLDNAGYPRGDDGVRVGPDGEPISFVIEVPDYDGNAIDIAQLLVGYWEEVGISAAFNISSQSLFFERKGSNAHDVTLVSTPGGAGQDVLLSPRFFFPSEWESDFAVAWAYWYNGTEPEIAEEPPEQVKRAMRLYDEIETTGDQAVQESNMREILEIAADQFYAIGVSTPLPKYGVAKNNLRNVLEPHIRSWIFPTPSPLDIEQWYFETAE